MYDARDFWERRGRDFRPVSMPLELAAIAETVRGLNMPNILEVGPGYGRVYEYLKPLGLAENYAMCDFVDSMRHRCEERTGVLPDHWDGITLPYEDGSFDLVLTLSVFLHVVPEHVQGFFTEQARVTRRYIYVATLREWGGTLGSHCFVHDYPRLFAEAEFKIVRERRFKERSHWLAEAS